MKTGTVKRLKMKKLALYLFCMGLGSPALAQERATIKISTSITHIDTSPIYKASITLGSGYSSLPAEVMKFETLKQRYKEALEKAGFPFESLIKNPNGFGYETLAQKKEGAIYEYTTTSMESMRKFMQIRPLGVESIYVVSVIELDTKETQKLAKLAIAQAKTKAAAIADGMGKKLGKIVHVADVVNRWGTTIETSVYYDRPANECKYSLDVTFAME